MEIRRLLPAILLISSAVFSLAAQSSKPIVSEIKAFQSSSDTTVTWNVPEEGISSITSLYVYRSSEAILSSDRLASLSPVAVLTADMTSWQEKAGTTLYYYAVIARLSDGSLYDILIPSVNATITPAEQASSVTETADTPLPAAQYAEKITESDGLRIKPLPSFRIFSTVNEGQSDITEQTLSAAQNLGAEGKQATDAPLYIAEEDVSDSSTGDTYLLHDIVTRLMLRKNWNRAFEELTALTQTYHSEEITARINLYLGQCSFFMNDYLGALQYFLHSEALYPDISKVWIQTTINAFTLPDFSE